MCAELFNLMVHYYVGYLDFGLGVGTKTISNMQSRSSTKNVLLALLKVTCRDIKEYHNFLRTWFMRMKSFLSCD